MSCSLTTWLNPTGLTKGELTAKSVSIPMLGKDRQLSCSSLLLCQLVGDTSLPSVQFRQEASTFTLCQHCYTAAPPHELVTSFLPFVQSWHDRKPTRSLRWSRPPHAAAQKQQCSLRCRALLLAPADALLRQALQPPAPLLQPGSFPQGSHRHNGQAQQPRVAAARQYSSRPCC